MKPMFFLCGLLLALGCKRETSAPPISAATNQTYTVRGVVQEIAPDFHHATIKHEKIPGYMASMTMDFSVKNTNELNHISAGDEIIFTLVVTADDDWIEKVQRTGQSAVPTPAPTWRVVESELNVGDALPDYSFTSENGPVSYTHLTLPTKRIV